MEQSNSISSESPLFQGDESLILNEVKGLVLRLNDSIGELREQFHMEVFRDNSQGREPYKNFYNRLHRLLNLTKYMVYNRKVVTAIQHWLNNTYFKGNDSRNDFEQGIKLAEEYISELYKLGIVDLNVSQSVAYPFQDFIDEFEGMRDG